MFAIFKREFKAFFHSIMGYLFIAANLVLLGIYFLAYNLSGAYPYFSYTISASVLIYLITIPLLTMRILSEDRKNKTDQLILTSPVSVMQGVVGKYMAVAGVFLILIAIVCFYPLIMSLYGEVPFAENYLAIFGFALYGLASIAIGVFISSITESQIIAAVLSFVALFLTYMMGPLCSLISTNGNWITAILSTLDMYAGFGTFLNGILYISSVVYYASIIFLMLFLTSQVIQKRRYSVSVKSLKMGAYSTTSIVVAIALVIVANILVSKIPEKYTVFDLTSNKMFSITDDTKNLLKTLNRDTDIIVYCAESEFDTNVAEILGRYEAESSHINVSYVDPMTSPKFYTKYSSDKMSSGTIIVQSGEKFRLIDPNDLYIYEYSVNYTTYSYDTTVTGIDAEGQITSAIAYVNSDEEHVVYFTSGHAETEFDEDYTELITKANATYESITLLTMDEVPEDAEILVINAVGEDFNEDDMNKVRDYINKGGNVILTMTPPEKTRPVLTQFLSEYGLNIQDYLVVDTNRGYYLQSPFYLLPEIQSTEYTSLIYNENYVFTPYCTAMNIAEEIPDNITVTELMNSSSKSYAKNITAELVSFDKEDGDVDGPFTIAAMVCKTNDDGSVGKLLVASSAYMFSASADSMVSGGNQRFFTGVLSDMVNIDTVVSIPSKSLAIDYLTLTQANVNFWGNLTTIIIPLGLLICGIVVWLRRRKK